MNASEARTLTKGVNTNTHTGQLAKINELIKHGIGKGDYSVWFYETMRHDVKKFLEDEGYKVTFQSERNESMYLISWKE